MVKETKYRRRLFRTALRGVIPCVLSLCLVACQKKAPQNALNPLRSSESDLPAYQSELAKRISVGMTHQEVLARFGEPSFARKNGTQESVTYLADPPANDAKGHEKAGGFVIVFDNDKVVSWQVITISY